MSESWLLQYIRSTESKRIKWKNNWEQGSIYMIWKWFFSRLCPSISYTDIVNYLVFRPSPYSADDMKAHKSLEAYNRVIEGWLRDVKVNSNENVLTVVKGKELLYTTMKRLYTRTCYIFIKTTIQFLKC